MALRAVPGYRLSPGNINYRPPTPLVKPAAKLVVPRSPGAAGVAPVIPTASAAPQIASGLPGVKTDYQSLVSNLVQQYGGPANVASPIAHTPAQAELEADPEWQQGLRTKSTAEDVAAQARANTFRNLVMASGYNPFSGSDVDPSRLGNLAQYSGDINQSTLDTAAQNQFSTRAQLSKQLSDAQSALPYQLAARGVARSGEAAQRSTAFQRDYQTQSNQALATLLDALNTGAGNYTSALGGAANQWEQTKNAIATRLSQVQGPTDQPSPDWSSFADQLSGILGGQPGAEMALAGTPEWGTPAGSALSAIGNQLVRDPNTGGRVAVAPTIQQGTGKKPKVVVPVGYGGGGWNYPVAKTGVVKNYSAGRR